VDVWRDTASGAALVVVMDYKSSGNKADRVKLHHGLQLQLPAYLAALEHLPEARQALAANQLVAAGGFFVNLRGEFRSTGSRAEALDDPAAALRKGYQHAGRFDETFVKKLDPLQNREQFRTHSNAHDPMRSATFRELLDRAILNLRRFGSGILSGKVAPDPYRRGIETACQNCDYASVCRFDPWTQPFRSLSEPPPVARAADAAPNSKRPRKARNK
jgi:ATP-dependent helicase/nuclease subunit B